MSKFDELTLKRIANDFRGRMNVPCQAGIADIITDDEVILTGSIDEWEKVFDQVQEFAYYLKLTPAIILRGEALPDEIDIIDEACNDDGVTFYYYDGVTLSYLTEMFCVSKGKAKRAADVVAARHGLGSRSNELLNYQYEMIDVLAENNPEHN